MRAESTHKWYNFAYNVWLIKWYSQNDRQWSVIKNQCEDGGIGGYPTQHVIKKQREYDENSEDKGYPTQHVIKKPVRIMSLDCLK